MTGSYDRSGMRCHSFLVLFMNGSPLDLRLLFITSMPGCTSLMVRSQYAGKQQCNNFYMRDRLVDTLKYRFNTKSLQMSETTYSQEECSLDALDQDRTRSNAYVAFFTQKSEANAKRFIYGITGSGSSPPNPGQIIDARRELSLNGYIHRINNGLKKVLFRSSVDPIINSIRSDTGRSRSHFDLESERGNFCVGALATVLDSEWFRQFFSYHATHNPYPGKNKGEFYSGYAGLRLVPYEFEDKTCNAVEVWHIKKLFLELIAEIGTYSYHLNSFFERNADVLKAYGYRSISSEELVAVHSFDDFCAGEMTRFCRCWVDDFYRHVSADEDLVKSFMTTVEPGFDVPKDLHRRCTSEPAAPAMEMKICSQEISEMRMSNTLPFQKSPRKTRFQKPREKPLGPVPGITSADIPIPAGFIERIKYPSACIPASVAGIMRMSYPQLPKWVGDRCSYAEYQLNKKILERDRT